MQKIISVMKNCVLVFILILFFASCYYDNVDEMHPDKGLTESCNPADTIAITYTKHIKPILDQHCGTFDNACHSANVSGGNNNPFNSYAKVLDAITFDGGVQLIASITQDDIFSTPPMPRGAAKLSDCKINKFKAWIKQGNLE